MDKNGLKTPQDLDGIYQELKEMFAMAKDDPRRLNQLDSLANAAGKLVNYQKVKLVYAISRGEMPDLPELGKTSGKPIPAGARLLKA